MCKRSNFYEKFNKSKMSSTIAKTIVEAISLLLVNIMISILIQYPNKWIITLAIGLPAFALYVLCTTVYNKLYEYRKRMYKSDQKKIEELNQLLDAEQKKSRSCENILLSMKTILDITARNINALSHKIAEEKIVSEELWSFRQTCTIVCRESYNALTTMYGNLNFEVSYVSIKYNKSNITFVLNSYENYDKERPSIYEEEIILPKNIKKKKMAQKYCFEKIVYDKCNEPVCYSNEETIKNNFFFKNPEAKEKCKYKQYIAIPVFCESKKIIGMMQIVSLDNGAMGNDDDLKFIARTLFKPLAYLSLLTHKTQKCIDTLVEVKNENA